ncbi:pyridoxal phosphate-dependent aminotransferase [Ruegeria arenilitoris]|uniref:pyridoxal phosphate-dependent aminotransferase n=1 Tax=Ruegeria arenilitoris TaxID=1173585 RepID=UPI001C2C4ED0|nr:histidinol-phosphate transaminase [Ruegeria arenilitoris]
MSEATQMEYKAGLSANDVSALAQGRAVTKLSSNENPFGPSPKAVAAAQAALEGANVYPERNDAALCGALADFHGRGLTPSHFFAANSGVEVLSLIEDACLTERERAIICPPCFGAYSASLQKKRAPIDTVALQGAGYQVDVDGILSAVTPETRLVYLCNPNNPTGTWFGEETLSAILDGLPDHVTLVYDEVYFQFATEMGLPDAIRHVLDGRNIVIVHSFSKAYGLAGMRLGYGIAPPEMTARIQRLKRAFHINTAGMAAAIAALTDKEHLKKTVDNNHSERKRLASGLRDLGLETSPSQANFVMFRCPVGHDADSLTNALVQEAVMVRPAFHLPHHIRATVGTPEDNTRLIAALKTVIGG